MADSIIIDDVELRLADLDNKDFALRYIEQSRMKADGMDHKEIFARKIQRLYDDQEHFTPEVVASPFRSVKYLNQLECLANGCTGIFDNAKSRAPGGSLCEVQTDVIVTEDAEAFVQERQRKELAPVALEEAGAVQPVEDRNKRERQWLSANQRGQVATARRARGEAQSW